MLEINILIVETFVLLAFTIIIFIFSLVSTDILISMLSFLLYLIILIPFFILLDKLELLIYITDLENPTSYNVISLYSKLIYIFIGLSLFIELVYLLIYN
jgi:hypothetical protein